MSGTTGRLVDHVVMPVETLGAARTLFETLGFTVAPDAAHPFGTGNACIFFADGTYIEPLAVIDRDLAETQAASGNAFLRRDLAFRLRHPLPGLSGIALKSVDALADRDAFVRGGYDGGDVLEFGRRFDGADGTARNLRFRLAFALDRDAPETFLFTCQRMFDFELDRAALTRHSNGVSALARIVYAAVEPAAFRPFLGRIFGAEPDIANSLGFSIAAGNVLIDVSGPDGLAARYGDAGANAESLHLAGLVLAVDSLAPIRRIAEKAGYDVSELLGRVVVRLPEPSRIFLAFEETAARK